MTENERDSLSDIPRVNNSLGEASEVVVCERGVLKSQVIG